jgi:hypothetical protein
MESPQRGLGLIIAVVILAFLLVGGYYVFLKHGEPASEENNDQLVTYRNDMYGFSFSYPQEWKDRKVSDDTLIASFAAPDLPPPALSIYVWGGRKSLEERQPEMERMGGDEEKDISIRVIDGKEVLITHFKGTIQSAPDVNVYFLPDNGKEAVTMIIWPAYAEGILSSLMFE